MPYTFETHNTDPSINAGGTCLQGYLKCPRSVLVEIFGEPIVNGYEDKVKCEWIIEAMDENAESGVITIYDWKNYNSDAMDDDYSDWNVGGLSKFSHSVLMEIIEVHNNNKIKQPTNVKVIVPQSDLDAIEEARIKLHEMFAGADTHTFIKVSTITEPMWKVANKKYEVVDK